MTARFGRPGVVFLDRDGVINRDSPEYILAPDDWKPIPGSLDALRRLHEAGERVVVVTNQSILGRGLVAPEVVDAIHDRMFGAVEAAGGRIEAVHVCPHTPADGCACRKPAPGLLHRAANTLGLEPKGIAFVGDKPSDLAAGRAAGCLPVFVASGQGRAEELDASEWREVPRFADLAAFVDARLEAIDAAGADSLG